MPPDDLCGLFQFFPEVRCLVGVRLAEGAFFRGLMDFTVFFVTAVRALI